MHTTLVSWLDREYTSVMQNEKEKVRAVMCKMWTRHQGGEDRASSAGESAGEICWRWRRWSRSLCDDACNLVTHIIRYYYLTILQH